MPRWPFEMGAVVWDLEIDEELGNWVFSAGVDKAGTPMPEGSLNRDKIVGTAAQSGWRRGRRREDVVESGREGVVKGGWAAGGDGLLTDV